MSKPVEKTESDVRAELLAHPAFFPHRHVFEKIIFAEMPAGDSHSHAVAMNLETRTLYCSCPFFPKPCVHTLALNALYAREGEDCFARADALPDRVQALISGSPASRERPAIRPETRLAARTQRRFERLERAAGGFADLEAWLLDTIRRGLATVVSEDPRWWENIAVRMADASMPGLSRTLRLLGQIPASDPAWAEKAASALAGCYLAARAFRKRDILPDGLPYDLQNFVGIAAKKEEVLANGERLHDVWAVLGGIEEPLEDKLSVRRTWLKAGQSGRYALLLDFAFGGAGFPPGLAPGSIHQGTLAYYPSAFPQRALLLDDWKEVPKRVEKPQDFQDFDTFADAYAGALAIQPWLPYFPAIFNAATVYRQGGYFMIADRNEKSLHLNIAENTAWRLLALGGNHPLALFGEWDGAALRPLTAVAEGRFVSLFDAGLQRK